MDQENEKWLQNSSTSMLKAELEGGSNGRIIAVAFLGVLCFIAAFYLSGGGLPPAGQTSHAFNNQPTQNDSRDIYLANSKLPPYVAREDEKPKTTAVNSKRNNENLTDGAVLTREQAEALACLDDPASCKAPLPPSSTLSSTAITSVETQKAENISTNDLSSSVITGSPARYKRKDRMLVLRSNQKPEEKIINFTPALIEATIGCSLTEMKALLDSGENVNMADERGETALAWAAKRGCSAGAQLLLERGAKVNAISKNGFTPYVWARIYKNREMQNLLKMSGANVSIGSYWWRSEDDGRKAWLDASLASLCKNHACD